MRKGNLSKKSEDLGESSTSEESSISSDDKDMKMNQSLRQTVYNLEKKLADFEKNQTSQTIKHYEDSLKDKNDLIKSLKTTIDLMEETKELSILQIQHLALQNGDELKKGTMIFNENPSPAGLNSNPSKSADSNNLMIKYKHLLTLQKKFEESQSQNAETMSKLDLEIIDLKSKQVEMENKLELSKIQSKAEQDQLRSRILELESNAKIYANNVKGTDDKISKLNSEIIDLKSKLVENKIELKILKNQTKADEDQLRSRILELESHAKNATNVQGKFYRLSNTTSTIRVTRNSLAEPENVTSEKADWLVILRRFDGSLTFNSANIFNEFGIGTIDNEYFIGFEILHRITNSCRHELYIKLVDFNNKKTYVRYDNFVVGSRTEGFALISLGSYSGNAGDALRNHEKCRASFKHFNPNKKREPGAEKNPNGVWWWTDNIKESTCCLTGVYKNGKKKSEDGIWWGDYNFQACKMMIRAK